MQPEFFSAAFMSALFAIVLIDLVLAGDNALIIGLVARNLPRRDRLVAVGTDAIFGRDEGPAVRAHPARIH